MGTEWKIYVAQNFGVDYGYGYQYLFSNGVANDKIPTKEPRTNDARNFVIDFTKDEDNKPIDPLAYEKLKHIVSLSMTFSQASGDRVFDSDYLFVMKSFTSDYKTGGVICIFDRHGFKSEHDIFSYDKFHEVQNALYRPMTITSVTFNGRSGTINNLDRETGLWQNQEFLYINHKLLFETYRINTWW